MTLHGLPRRTKIGAAVFAGLLAALLLPAAGASADTTLPTYTYRGEVTVAEDLAYNPTGEFIFPSVFHAGAHLQNPLGEWYLYYAPHEDPGGIAFLYADSLDGPWTEYADTASTSSGLAGTGADSGVADHPLRVTPPPAAVISSIPVSRSRSREGR
jgi:hypothetical protein